MADSSLSPGWTISTAQKELPIIGALAGHNYLILRDPQGNIVSELHGVPSKEFAASGLPGVPNPSVGNYLQIRQYPPDFGEGGYAKNQQKLLEYLLESVRDHFVF